MPAGLLRPLFWFPPKAIEDLLDGVLEHDSDWLEHETGDGAGLVQANAGLCIHTGMQKGRDGEDGNGAHVSRDGRARR